MSVSSSCPSSFLISYSLLCALGSTRDAELASRRAEIARASLVVLGGESLDRGDAAWTPGEICREAPTRQRDVYRSNRSRTMPGATAARAR